MHHIRPYKKILASTTLLVLAITTIASAPQVVFAATETLILSAGGAGTWQAPAGVTSVQIEVWAAGGGGGGGTGAAGNGGGGGAGGGYAKKNTFSVTPGNTYNYYIGRGGTGGTGTGNGSAGEDSMFNASTTVLAKGGGGGSSLANGSGGGATTTTAVGDTVFHGGNGGNGTGTSGGGGGGAGNAANGAKGNNGGTGGAGGTSDGGAGGDGQSGNKNGVPGNNYGGGGSGADSNNTANRTGGDGAVGQLKLTYTVYTILADTTDPANDTIVGGDPAVMADAFTFQTSTSTDVVSAVVVGLGTGASGGVGLVEITDSSGATVYGSTSDPGSDTPSVTLSTNTLTANTTATTYKIRITPKAVVSGGPYSVTAKINSWTGTNTQHGSDTAGTTITINDGPVGITVTTDPATNVTGTSATLNGTKTGGGSATEHGFAYSTDATLVTGVSTTTLGSLATNDPFSVRSPHSSPTRHTISVPMPQTA